MAAQQVRRPRESRGHRIPEDDEPRGARAASGLYHRRRRVHRVARRHQTRRPGRTRLLVQVEHGMDARHARLFRPRSHAPVVAPERHHVRDDLRVQRALHHAAVARRGGPRQALAARQNARRSVAEVRQPAAAARVPVHAARQEAALHGHGARPARRMESRRELAWHLATSRRARRSWRSSEISAGCTASMPRSGATTTIRAASSGSTSPTPRTRWCRTCAAMATSTWWWCST